MHLDHDVALATPPTFPLVRSRATEVLDRFAPELYALADRSQPTAPMMRTLADELERGRANPTKVAHPELLDPQRYWELALWPQAAATVREAREVLVQVADAVSPVVVDAERLLEDWLDELVVLTEQRRAADPVHNRDVVIDAIANACQSLHRTVEIVRSLQLGFAALDQLDAELSRQRRRRAEAFVKAAHDSISDPDDKAHWAATFDARVADRDTELAAALPFRHGALALAAHRKARESINADIELMIATLTEPILGMGERLVIRYDRLTAPR